MTKSLSAIRSTAASSPKARSGRTPPPCRPPPMAAQQGAGKVVCGGNALFFTKGKPTPNETPPGNPPGAFSYPAGRRSPAFPRASGRDGDPERVHAARQPSGGRPRVSSHRHHGVVHDRALGETEVRLRGIVIDRGVAVRLRDHHVVPRKPQGKRVVDGPSQGDLLVGQLDREHDGNLAFRHARA